MNWAEFIITLGQSLSYVAFWVGFVLVIIFAQNRFALSEAESEKDDPRVVPRSFTTRFRYSLSAIVYIGYFEFFYGLLVGIGSLPVLQDLLTQWIGSLALPAEDSTVEIGTPAWAALFVTTVLPAAPGFSTVDTIVRKKLHNFASIPYKARGLALEIVDHLTVDFFDSAGDNATDIADDDETNAKLKTAQLAWLLGAIEKLQSVNFNAAKAGDYKAFFDKDYQQIWSEAKEKNSLLEGSIDLPDSATTVIAPERDALVNSTARFLSCGLLLNESSERDARNVIRDRLGIADLPTLPFDFSLKQIILNLVLVLLLTFFSSVVALGLTLPDGWRGISSEIIGAIVYWLPFIAITMVTPFVFAAGVQLYFMDRQQLDRRKIPFEDRLLALIFLLLGTFGVGLLPTLLGMVAGNYDLSEKWVMQVVPSGLTPAFVALLFFILSSRRLTGSKWLDAVLDLGLFSAVAGFCSWLAATIAFHAGMDVAAMMRIDSLTNDVVLIVSPVTHAVMVGVIGAVQCSISRTTLSRRTDKDPDRNLKRSDRSVIAENASPGRARAAELTFGR